MSPSTNGISFTIWRPEGQDCSFSLMPGEQFFALEDSTVQAVWQAARDSHSRSRGGKKLLTWQPRDLTLLLLSLKARSLWSADTGSLLPSALSRSTTSQPIDGPLSTFRLAALDLPWQWHFCPEVFSCLPTHWPRMKMMNDCLKIFRQFFVSIPFQD